MPIPPLPCVVQPFQACSGTEGNSSQECQSGGGKGFSCVK